MVGVLPASLSVPWAGVGQLQGAGEEVVQPLLGPEPKLWAGKRRVLVGASSFKITSKQLLLNLFYFPDQVLFVNL